jgi:hypothetical protein
MPGFAFNSAELEHHRPGLLEHSASGFAGGVHVGAQKQWANIVAGIECFLHRAIDAEHHVSHHFLGVPAVTRSSDVSNPSARDRRLGYAQDNMLRLRQGWLRLADVDLAFRLSATTTAGILERS